MAAKGELWCGPFIVVRFSDQCLIGRETGVDFVLIQASLLFI